jgi:hypothetical protein
VTEVPEDDAIEQAWPVDPEDVEPDPPTPGLEAPEADVVEQSIPVPIVEDDYR